MKRTTALLLIVGLLCAMATPVGATTNENTIQPRWAYLNTVVASLDINWLGVATCEGTAVVRGSMDVKTVVRLQQKLDSGWYTVETWSDTGTGAAGASGKIAVARGYDYRVTVSA